MKNRYQKLFELSNDLMCIASFEGFFIEVNDVWIEKLGYSKEELISSHYEQFVHPHDKQDAIDKVERLLNGQNEEINYENRFLIKNGGYIWLQWSATIDHDEKQVYAVARDISSIKFQEENNRSFQNAIVNLANLSTLDELKISDFQQHFIEQIHGLFDVDFVTYWVFDAKKDRIICQCEAETKLRESMIGKEILRRDCPKYFKSIEDEMIVIADSAHTHPATSEFSGNYLDHYGIHSMLDLHVYGKSELEGVICLEQCSPRKWKAQEANTLMALVNIFSNSILIHEDKKLQDNLFKAYELLEGSNEIARIGSWEVNLQDMTVNWSSMTCAIHEEEVGFKPSVENAIMYYQEGWSRDTIAKVFNKCVETGAHFDEELIIITKTGKERWVRAVGNAILSDGQVVGVHGLFQDIDERRRAEEEVQRLSIVASEVHNSVVITSGDQKVQWVNESFIALTGYELEEVRGKVLGSILQGDDTDPKDRERIKHGVLSGKPFTQEILNYRKDGNSYWIELSVTPIYDQNDKLVQFVGIQNDITQRKVSEKVLRSERQRLSNVIEGTNVGTWEWNVQTGEIKLNEAWANMLGYSLEELEPIALDRWSEFSFPKDVAMSQEALERHFRRETEMYEMESRMLHKNGSIVWVWDRGKVISWTDEGEPLMMFGTHTDITARKSAQEDLKAERQRLANLIEGTNVGTWEWNVQTGEAVFNERWAEMIGYTLEELSPIDIETRNNLVYEDDLGWNKEALERHFNGDTEYYDVQCRMKHKDGSLIWVWDRGKVVSRNEEGKPLMMFGTYTDITVQKEIEQKLAESRQFVQRIFDRSVVGIYLIDTKTHEHIYLNERYATLTGYTKRMIDSMSREESINRFHPDDRRKVQAFWNKIKNHPADATIDPIEYRLKKGNGQWAWFQSWVVPFELDENGKIQQYLGSLMDITAQKQATEEVQKMQKLESLGLVAGGIAHDFNNMLTSMFSNLELIKLNSNGQSNEVLNDTLLALKDARKLTGQLLTFAKGGAPVLESVDTDMLVRQNVEFSLRGSNVMACFDIEEDVWPINVDKGQIGQVFSNLTINAKQAMPSGGKLYINVRNYRSENKKVTNQQKLEEFVIFEWQDQGSGIKTIDMPKIFDPYYSTKESGHGLGLAIVHSIIAQHNGQIEVESEEGVGTKFTVLLPKSVNKVKTENTDDSAKDEPILNANVLIVDDEQMILKATKILLQTMGFKADTASDGEEAVDRIRSKISDGEAYNLVILDLTIRGGKGGKDIINDLKNIDPDIVAIASSGYATDPVLANYEEYGFAGRLAKPYTIEELENEIKRILIDV